MWARLHRLQAAGLASPAHDKALCAGLELLDGILNMAKPGSIGKLQPEHYYGMTADFVMTCSLGNCMLRCASARALLCSCSMLTTYR